MHLAQFLLLLTAYRIPQKNGESSSRNTVRAGKDVNDQSLPTELDFFKYAEGGQGKRKMSRKDGGRYAKRMKVDGGSDGSDEEEEGDGDEEERRESNVESSTPRQQHKISVKGINPPKEAATFEEMKERYSIPTQLYANLEKNDYQSPTGIQSIGVPTLLEVSRGSNALRTLLTQPFSLEMLPPSRPPVLAKHYPTSFLFLPS